MKTFGLPIYGAEAKGNKNLKGKGKDCGEAATKAEIMPTKLAECKLEGMARNKKSKNVVQIYGFIIIFFLLKIWTILGQNFTKSDLILPFLMICLSRGMLQECLIYCGFKW